MPSTTPISTRNAIGVNASDLRDQHAGQAVDPARRLDAEPSPSSCVTMPERPKRRMSARPMTKGGRDDRQHGQRPQERLERKPVRVAISAKARPSSVGPAPTRTARNSVFQATPQRSRPSGSRGPRSAVGESFATKRRARRRRPRSRNALEQHLQRSARRRRARRARPRGRSRRRRRRRRRPHRARPGRGERNRKAAAQQQRAVAHAELAGASAPKSAVSQRAPAAQADGEALHSSQREAGRPDRRAAARPNDRIAPSAARQREERQQQEQAERQQPRLAPCGHLERRRRRVRVERIAVEQPA